MALADNHRQRATTIGRRTWFCTGTSLVVMGMVAMAAELVLQQKLNRSKFGQSGECVSQSANVKVGIWCGIPVSIVHLKMTHRPSVCRSVRPSVFMYVCAFMHVCVYKIMYICKFVCVHAFLCVCVCVWVYVRVTCIHPSAFNSLSWDACKMNSTTNGRIA